MEASVDVAVYLTFNDRIEAARRKRDDAKQDFRILF